MRFHLAYVHVLTPSPEEKKSHPDPKKDRRCNQIKTLSLSLAFSVPWNIKISDSHHVNIADACRKCYLYLSGRLLAPRVLSQAHTRRFRFLFRNRKCEKKRNQSTMDMSSNPKPTTKQNSLVKSYEIVLISKWHVVILRWLLLLPFFAFFFFDWTSTSSSLAARRGDMREMKQRIQCDIKWNYLCHMNILKLFFKPSFGWVTRSRVEFIR